MKLTSSLWRVMLLGLIFLFVLSPITLEEQNKLGYAKGLVALTSLVAGWLIASLVLDRRRSLKATTTLLAVIALPLVGGLAAVAVGSILPAYGVMPYFGALFLRSIRMPGVRLLPATLMEWMWCIITVIVFTGVLVAERQFIGLFY